MFRLAILCTVLHITAGQCKWTVPDVYREIDVYRFMYLTTADFLTVPSDACVSPGDVVDFRCTTVYFLDPLLLPTQQEWVVTPTAGPVIEFSSFQTAPLPSGFSFIMDPDLSGIRVTATSNLNDATFQCIALRPSTLERNNTALAIATLQVAGTAWHAILIHYKHSCHASSLRRAKPVQLWAGLLPHSLLTWSGQHVHSAVECTVDCRLCSTHKLHHHIDEER